MTFENTNPARASEVEDVASQWVQRKHFWAWTGEDQAALDAWLSQSPAHRVAYIRLDAALKRSKRLAALKAPPRAAAPEAGFRPILSKFAAASVLLALLGGGVALLTPAPTEATYSTPMGGRQTLALADGTRIELNTNTTLRVSLSEHERKVWLEKGEAYFQVTHNAARPFTVFAGDKQVVDLGTKFLLRREPGRLEVALMEGRIALAAKAGGKPSSTVLNSGDAAVVTANAVSVTRKTPKFLIEQLGWRRGVVTFDRTTLADAVAEFNRYNRHKLVVTDPAAGRITIGGTFDVNNVDTFIDIAKEDFGLHAENRGDETVISK